MLRMSLAVVVITAASSSGCLHSNLDENWGESFEAQAVWQRADPDAPATTDPPENLDPETGKRVAERYYRGQEQQRQRQAPSVLIGEVK
jgi:hypothetical protein